MKLSNPSTYLLRAVSHRRSAKRVLFRPRSPACCRPEGYSVTIQKLDPYINVDPGTLNPYEHGECYVTGTAPRPTSTWGTRALHEPAHVEGQQRHDGQDLQERDREGAQGASTWARPCRSSPITDEIKRRIQMLAQKKVYDVIITEIGGTVGDIESLPFIESVRQLRYSLGYKSTALVHLTLIPYMAASGELKTKPTQHSVKACSKTGCSPTSSCAHGASAVDQPAPQSGVVLQCRRQRRDGVDRRADDLRSAR